MSGSIYEMPDIAHPLGAGQAGASANPLAMAAQVQQLQNAQASGAYIRQNTENAQLENHYQHMKVANQVLGSLLSIPGGPQDQDIARAAAHMQATGFWTQDDASKMLANIPPAGPERQKFLMQAQIANGSTMEQIHQQQGQPSVINSGDQQHIIQIPGQANLGNPLLRGSIQNQISPQFVNTGDTATPTVGGRVAGAPIGMNMSPGEANQLHPILGPDGRPALVTTGAAVAGGAGRGPAMPTRYGEDPKPMGLPSGPSAGTTEAIGQQTTTNSGAVQQIQKEAQQAKGDNATLGNMLGSLTDFTPGPGSQMLHQIQAAAGRFGLNPDPKATSGYEEFKKLSSQIAGQQSAGGTDARMANAALANPNADVMSADGIKKVTAVLQGNNDYVIARNEAYQKLLSQQANPMDTSKIPASQFNTQWNKEQDPRAFQLMRMTPDERAHTLNSMNDKDKSTVLKAVRNAAKQGILSIPGYGQPSGQ